MTVEFRTRTARNTALNRPVGLQKPTPPASQTSHTATGIQTYLQGSLIHQLFKEQVSKQGRERKNLTPVDVRDAGFDRFPSGAVLLPGTIIQAQDTASERSYRGVVVPPTVRLDGNPQRKMRPLSRSNDVATLKLHHSQSKPRQHTITVVNSLDSRRYPSPETIIVTGPVTPGVLARRC